MSSPPSPPHKAQATSASSSSSVSGPYGPRNTLDKGTPPGFAAVNSRLHEPPKFGSTTPMKSTLAPISGIQASTAVNRRLDYSGSDYTKHDGHGNAEERKYLSFLL